MHQIDTPNATPDGEFQNGNPSLSQSGTLVDADWLNAVQRDLLGTYAAGGVVPVKGQDLLAAAIFTMVENSLAEALVPTVQVLAPYAVNVLDFLQVGEALFGRALGTATAGAVLTVQLTGKADLVAIQSGTAWGVGDRVYWDDALRVLTPVAATGRILAGLALSSGNASTAVVNLRFAASGEGPLP